MMLWWHIIGSCTVNTFWFHKIQNILLNSFNVTPETAKICFVFWNRHLLMNRWHSSCRNEQFTLSLCSWKRANLAEKVKRGLGWEYENVLACGPLTSVKAQSYWDAKTENRGFYLQFTVFKGSFMSELSDPYIFPVPAYPYSGWQGAGVYPSMH